MSNNSGIAVGIGIVASIIASFLLFAIAFNTPFQELRLKFTPVYIGLIFVSLIASFLSQHRVIVILFATLSLPVLMLLYVASQRTEFLIDAASLVALCAMAANFANNSTRRSKKASSSPE